MNNKVLCIGRIADVHSSPDNKPVHFEFDIIAEKNGKQISVRAFGRSGMLTKGERIQIAGSLSHRNGSPLITADKIIHLN